MKKSILTFVLALVAVVSFANNMVTEPVVEPVETDVTVLNSALNPFCKAIVLGKLDVVKQMIELGEDVNQKCLGKTPAMYAARYNKVEIFRLLVANGANLSIKSDKEDFTAEKFAELSNATEIIAIITSEGQV
ncbi:ankyrin repeat domain-containing protein [Neptunitalea lumnitzerae]|uniref:Ankyrin repeat domain-containing protein n=1 Tax=Neptunitalea lumnitzerae TaxID=2965509 RepID=A0ABQ5MG16_9FLAO|nr:ankyrin repeat domain-containing protein [Neptunitalea sp. Y10]GLB48361.1 hypothetical protein Y10_07290 [Neptunitalea sp. Y10]